MTIFHNLEGVAFRNALKAFSTQALLLPLLTTTLPAIEIDSIGLNLGVSNIANEKKDTTGSITLTKTPQESYTHSELYMLVDGFIEDKTIKASLNYINNTNSDFKNNILMLGINKYYQLDSYNIYTGILVGIGHQEWKYNPLANTTNTNYTTSSGVGAIQIGAEYNLQNNIALGLNTKYYLSNYTTNLDIGENSSEITHKSSYSLSFGLRYSF